jgi:hypothetical protein
MRTLGLILLAIILIIAIWLNKPKEQEVKQTRGKGSFSLNKDIWPNLPKKMF